jgi:hypothetical protein
MYILIRGRHRTNRQTGRWVDADLAAVPVATLTSVYGDVYLYVTYPNPGDQVFALRFDKVSHLIASANANMTVQQWLTSLGNLTLPFEPALPDETVKYVYYGNTWHAGYRVQPVARTGHVDDITSSYKKEDLLLTHPKHDYQKIMDHCLQSVNGYYHLSDAGPDGIRVVDGNTTVRIANDNQLGMTSFEKVAKLKCYPITAEMVHAQRPGAPLYDACYVKLPTSIDLTDKTVLLVLGGYLHVMGKSYLQVAEHAYRIELGSLLFVDRLLNSRTTIDLSSLDLTEDPENPSLLSVAELKRDSTVLAYLTLSQSFFVVVDTPTLFHEFEQLESLRAPGRYMGHERLYYPVVGAYGKQLEYHIIEEHGQYVYACTNNRRANYDANRRNWQAGSTVDGGRYPAHPFREASAFLRVMGTQG